MIVFRLQLITQYYAVYNGVIGRGRTHFEAIQACLYVLYQHNLLK